VIHSGVAPRPEETSGALAGDDVVPAPDIIMDRAFTLPVPPSPVSPPAYANGSAPPLTEDARGLCAAEPTAVPRHAADPG
jgi:hypothetical protein